MNTLRVRTIRDHIYDAKNRKVGDVYDIEERHKELLTRIGYVKVEEVEERKEDDPPKGRYNRRDMRPQEK